MTLNSFHRTMISLVCGLVLLSPAAPVFGQETAPKAAPATSAEPPADAGSSKVVATYSLGEITQAEVDRLIGVQLARLAMQRYDLETRTIRQMVSERLLRAQALKEGMTRDQFYDTYVTARITEPTDAQVDQVMKQYRSQLPKDDGDARKLVRQALKDRQKRRLEKALEASLLRGANLQIKLEEPRFPVKVATDDPVRGPADAPVTIVEFSDFQCPFCSRVQTTLHRIMETYPAQVRIVFKNMPGQRHDRAKPAAEAAMCAGRQGKFWEMHDWLYTHQKTLDDESLNTGAKELGLDMDAFATCTSKHQTMAQVEAGLKEAQALGLNGTPIFFVNGRMIRGARPFEVFDEAIRSELKRLGIAAPPKAPAVREASKPPAAAPAAKPVGAGTTKKD